MTRPIVHIYDAVTQEEVIREMNDEEYAQHLIDIEASAPSRAEQEQREAAKAAVHEKLSEMGITPELIEVIKKL